MKLTRGKNLFLMAQFSLLLVFAFVFILIAVPSVSAATATTVKVGWIVYNGDWNADSSAPYNLAYELEARTGQDVTVDFVRLNSIDNVKQYDILILTGHNYFSFSDTERAVLKAYLEGCGLLFIDDCNNYIDSRFEVSARAEMLNILGVGLSPLPSNHEVFSSFYSLGGTPPTQWNNEPLEGIIINGSTKVIYSDNDYTCGWENYASWYTIENSYRVAVNLVMYAASKAQCITPIDIDIKPGSDPNSINIDSRGVIPVAILTTDEFDAAGVNPDTVLFGPLGAYPEHHALEDVDYDGDIDMILHFRTQDTGIALEDIEAVLTGETYDGRKIEGSDSVRVLESKGRKK